MLDVTLVDNEQQTTECEDRARILETEFAIEDVEFQEEYGEDNARYFKMKVMIS